MKTRRASVPQALLPIATALMVTALMAPDQADAGARPVEMVLVYVGPDSKDAKKCHRGVKKALSKADDVVITMSSPKKVARRLGTSQDELAKSWFHLPDADYKKAFFEKPMRSKNAPDPEDSVILLSCEPGDNVVRLVVHAPSGDVYRFRFAGARADRKLIATIARFIVVHSYQGFSV